MVLSPEIAYDGVAPFPGTGRTPCTAVGRARAGVTVAIVVLPFAGLAAAMWLAWGHGLAGQLRGLAHAHVGWLLRGDPTPPGRYAPDLMADPGARAVSAAFPALCAASLALPFGAGWAIGGTWYTALTALL